MHLRLALHGLKDRSLNKEIQCYIKTYRRKNRSTERPDFSSEVTLAHVIGEGTTIEEEVKTHQWFLGIKVLSRRGTHCIAMCRRKQTPTGLAFVCLTEEEMAHN